MGCALCSFVKLFCFVVVFFFLNTATWPGPLSGRSDDTNTLSKVSVLISKKNIFIHSRVFVSFSHVHINAFPFENALFLMRFRLPSTLKRPETQIKTTVCDYVTVMKRLRFHLFPGVLVWKIGENAPKSIRFQMKTQCGWH